MCSSDIFLGILAILFPPLPVWVKRGLCSADSLINILLCCLGFIPGLLHAWYIIAKFPDPDYEYEALPQDSEGGRVRYIIIDRAPGHQPTPKPQQGPNYGTQGGGNNNSGRSGNRSHAPAPAPQRQGVVDAGEGTSDGQGVPPSYAEVVAGDHKVQSSD